MEDEADFSASMPGVILGGEQAEAFGIAGQDATGKAQERFLAALAPGEQFGNEIEEFSIGRQGRAGEGSDRGASKGGALEFGAEVNPGIAPAEGHSGLSGAGELMGQLSAGFGRGRQAEELKQDRFVGGGETDFVNDIGIAARALEMEQFPVVLPQVLESAIPFVAVLAAGRGQEEFEVDEKIALGCAGAPGFGFGVKLGEGVEDWRVRLIRRGRHG